MIEVSESTRDRLLQAVAPATSTEPFAAAVELGIRTEGFWRRVADLELAGPRALGIRTQASRWRAKELRDAAALRAAAGIDVARPPTAHWHQGGDGPALLLVNGWTASGLVWPSEWLRRLESAFFVVRVDNRGTGWSRTAPAPFTIADLADDARDVLRACGVERATVLGLSMGGMIAQELAIRHPEVVERLVLVGTAPPVPDRLMPDPAPFAEALRRPPAGTDLRAHFERLWSSYTGPEFAEGHPELLDELVTQVLRRVTPRKQTLDQVRAISSWHGASRLRRLVVPTTVVHGNRDPLMPVGNGMRLARLIPGADYRELPGVGHLVPHEAGSELLDVLGVTA